MDLSHTRTGTFHTAASALEPMSMRVSPAERSLHKHRAQTCGCQGEGEVEGWEGSVGLVGANYYIQNRETMKSQRVAQGALFSVLG